MTLHLAQIRDFAHRFVPRVAADARLYTSGSRSWWPAHEIGHFLVATADECRQDLFGLDAYARSVRRQYRYAVVRELAATSISQRILRRSGHVVLADDEIQYTDGDTLECSFEPWCRRAVRTLLRANRVARLPTTSARMERLLTRKLHEVR